MARELGHVNVDKMLDSISYSQAKEWEMYSSENPLPHEQIMHQLALIAYRFALAFIKFKDGSHFEYKDFLPQFGKDNKKEESKFNIIDAAKNMVSALGDEKAKERLLTEEELKPVIGTDGKRYKYALEERVPERTIPPKRKQRTKFGSRFDYIKGKETKKPVRMKKVYND
jgi:hypothetical protein